jgi:phosphonate transport system substrate-binding protein
MRRLLTALCALWLGAPHLAAAAVFTVGVLPVHSASIITKRYEPLRVYLEAHLKQPVRVESAPDFARFHARTLRGDFDLTITAAHFARLAQKEAGLAPLAQFTPDHDSLLVYSAERPLAHPRDLRGRPLAVIDRLAITAMAAFTYLDEQGLDLDRDYPVTEHRTHASVAHALMSGLAAAAVTTSQGMLQIPDDLRRKLVVHKHIADIPAFVFLAKSAQAERLRGLILAFPQEVEGIDFLGQTGYTGLIPATEARLKRVDGYLKATRRILTHPAP